MPIYDGQNLAHIAGQTMHRSFPNSSLYVYEIKYLPLQLAASKGEERVGRVEVGPSQLQDRWGK